VKLRADPVGHSQRSARHPVHTEIAMRAIDDFEDVSILDNFYQTSSFFPMPVVLVGTLAENGQTNLGPYSLCFPHVVSGQHAMMLIARGTSNTAANIRRTGRATINSGALRPNSIDYSNAWR
jgi:hypothetical protein